MQPLDIATFPLDGTRLIEASAGTGKTFTLTALYLRLLLERDFDIDHILVVTFTEAATEELRARIRSRLREAEAAFTTGVAGDPVIDGLLSTLMDHPGCAQRLRDAITRLDEAAIFTIHGFCRRMLTEHAFESGALFDTDLTPDERPLLQAIVNDFWRRRFYVEDAAGVSWVARRWAAPADLLKALGPLLGNGEHRVLPEVDEARLADAEAALVAAYTRAEQEWSGDTIEELLLQAEGLGRAAETYRPDRVRSLVEAAIDYFGQDDPRNVPTELAALKPAALAAAMTRTALKKGIEPPRHPFFERCETLLKRAGELDVLRETAILRDAAGYLNTELSRRKRETRRWSYNDLLMDLDAALRGDGGKRLAGHIRARYPVALVDEFQDTDPLQYRIFATVYERATRADGGAWLMIGDPKQSIYGFRGADIFTYIQARRDTDPRTEHFTLGTNWRSAKKLVTAVNTLFGRSDAAFIFNQDIEFLPVEAAGRADESPLRIDGESLSALHAWFVESNEDTVAKGKKTIAKTAWAYPNLSRAVAEEIARLLRLARDGRATLGDAPLRARDIAVLVRDRHEAAAVRQALNEASVKSVYYSRDSVFATPEAGSLERVLAAVAEPGNERLLRAALASDLIGADAETLAAAGDEDPRWLDWLARFQDYHDVWAADGFMSFFQRLLREQGVAARWLAALDGERRLTNLLQLGELTQAASLEAFGMEAVLRWLGENVDQPDGEAEAQQLRLESDAELVRIVTIHKSKGLEYPIVFLPFIWGARPAPDRLRGGRHAPVAFHDPDGYGLTVDLGSDQHARHHDLCDRERLAEDLRLLYVALTRARHRCYLSWGQFHSADQSALGYLLHPACDGGSGMKKLDDDALRAAWAELRMASGGAIELIDLPPVTGARAPIEAVAPEDLCARSFSGRVPRGWQIASYSGLIAARGTTRMEPEPFVPEAPDHDAVDAPRVDVPPPAPARAFSSIFQFPRGARAGTFMHTLLENLDFPGAGGPSLERAVERGLERHGFDARWRPVMVDTVARVLDAELGGGLRLRDVPDPRKLVEMEFYFPVGGVNHTALNGFLAEYRGEANGPELSFGTIEGLLKGFVDLIFEHHGRFYIIDYKSNHLGDAPEDYRSERLSDAIREHHYDLQYLIYTVALRRYLARRVPDYDYARHFGGVYYLFLRGMGEGGHGVFHDRPSPAQVDALDRLFKGN